MAVEGRTLDVQYGNTKTYYTVTNLDIDASLLGSKMPLRLWLNTMVRLHIPQQQKQYYFLINMPIQ